MKRFIVFVGLLAFLAVAYKTHYYLKQSVEDQEVIEWANSLIWAAIGSQSSVQFVDPRVAETEQPEQWVVSGKISLRQGITAAVVHPYTAQVAQLCDATDRRECWQLDRLVIGGSEVDLTGLESNFPGAASPLATGQPGTVGGTARADGMSPVQAPGQADAGMPAGQTAASVEPASANGSANAPTSAQDGVQQDGTARLNGNAAAEPGASEVATLSSESAPAATAETTQAAATAATPPAATDGVTTLSPEATEWRQMIAEIQTRLLDLGYDPGPVDGLMGPQTKTAIEAYQRKNDFTVDGEPSRQLLQLLELQQ